MNKIDDSMSYYGFNVFYLISDNRYLSDSVNESRFVVAVSSQMSFGKHDSFMVLTNFILAEYVLAKKKKKIKQINIYLYVPKHCVTIVMCTRAHHIDLFVVAVIG